MSSKSAVEVVESITAAIARLDLGKFYSMLAEDIVAHFPYLPEPFPKQINGKAGFEQIFTAVTGLFSEYSWTAMDLFITEQDPALVIGRASATATMKSGEGYSNEYVFFWRIVDGKLAEYHEYFDSARAMSAFASLQQ